MDFDPDPLGMVREQTLDLLHFALTVQRPEHGLHLATEDEELPREVTRLIASGTGP